jgi:hypothetical protein
MHFPYFQSRNILKIALQRWVPTGGARLYIGKKQKELLLSNRIVKESEE